MKYISKRRQRIGIIVAMLVLVTALVAAYQVFNSTDNVPEHVSPQTSQTTTKTSPQTSASATIRLIATGDMLPHDTVNQAARSSTGYDYSPMFSKIQPYLKDADLSFCNQESPSDAQLSVSGYPTFNAPASFAKDLSAVGCNIINLANNHANDRGQAGVTATRQLWSTLSAVAVAGTARNSIEQQQISTFAKAGIKFAFLSYSKCSNSTLPNGYGVNILSRPLVDKQITAARAAGAQMIIVGTHWCHENTSTQDAEQDMWANYFASKGVDIVIGTGPHWLQPVKKIPKAGGGATIVWFSLGNMLSSQLEINGLIGGIAVMEIDVKTHNVSSVGFMPTYMHYEWTAAQAAQGSLLARHNLMIYPLDQAAAALARSQNHTTVDVQTRRVTALLNKYTHIDMLTSQTYMDYGRR